MDLDKLPLALKVGVFLVFAGVALFILIMGFSIVFAGRDEAISSVGNYTANTTHWTGFTQTATASPLLVWIIFGGLVCFAIWEIVKHGHLPGRDRQ